MRFMMLYKPGRETFDPPSPQEMVALGKLIRRAPAPGSRIHDVVAPSLPCHDDAAGLDEYVEVVLEAIGDRRDLVVVAQSLGGLVAARSTGAAASEPRRRS